MVHNLNRAETMPNIYADDVFGDLEPIPQFYGCFGVVATVAFFRGANVLVSKFNKPQGLTVEFWRFKNLYISWIHAIVTGLWSLLSIYLYPEMLQDLLSHHNPLTYALVVFSTGYFVYDFCDIALHKRILKQREVVIHHIIIFAMFFYNLMICRYIAYTAVALLAEVNSTFLHSRKLMQFTKVSFSSLKYRLNCALNLLTFLIFRFYSIGYILYGMYMWRARTSIFFYSTLTLSMLIMVPINIVLLSRLAYSDVLRPSVKKTVKPATNGKSSNGSISNGTHHNDSYTSNGTAAKYNGHAENGHVKSDAALGINNNHKKCSTAKEHSPMTEESSALNNGVHDTKPNGFHKQNGHIKHN